MPAPVISPSSPSPASRPPATLKQRSHTQPKKRRVVRRRGRTAGGIDSDDEIEREAATDSESDHASSSDSETDDSDTEPASEGVASNAHPTLHTPTTSQGDGAIDKEAISHLNGDVASFFEPTANWSEMVADETANGPADLPVIDFANFDNAVISPVRSQPPKPKKPAKKSRKSLENPPQPSSTNEENADDQVQPGSNTATSHPPSDLSYAKRPPGQTVRQAYQQRLESDPSFVPKVGGFWNHDDRLMDKEYRSLSGWWRGRWQGRGRGGFPMRGGDRGGFAGQSPSKRGPDDMPFADTQNLPPIERTWGHDGFEEMKQREEQPRTQNGPPGAARGGRGSFVPRGGSRGHIRGGFAGSPRRFNPPPMPSDRVWFAMKPEPRWTKQQEAFLFFEPTLKPRLGQGAGFRVRLPGDHGHIVRTPPKSHMPLKEPVTKPTTSSEVGSEIGERLFVVNLPKRAGKERAMEPATTVEELPLDEVFAIRPHAVSAQITSVPEASDSSVSRALDHPSSVTAPIQTALPEPSVVTKLEQLSLTPQTPDPERAAKMEQAVLRGHEPDGQANAETQPEQPVDSDRPNLPALQTVFTPPPIAPSPGYGSPYGYAHALPPGLGMNQHGMPFELATGRPVYLQPPAAMYNPRPFIPEHIPAFVPGHMHHPSAVSPDFLSQTPSHTPPVNGFIDPSTGAPIFSFPRQTSRIEIRAPDGSGKPSAKAAGNATSSSLRTSAAAFEPSRPLGNMDQVYYPTEGGMLPSYESGDGSNSVDGQQHHVGAPMMAFPNYQQQHYYYPDTYGGYPPYMDMSQVGQYDMYSSGSMDQSPQGTVYY